MNNLKHTMQVILSKLGQGIILWVGFFAVAGVAFAAITWPSTLPDGESDGGTFATILKQVLENTDLTDTTNTGTVKYARDSDKVDGLHANELLAAGGGGESSGPVILVYRGNQSCEAWMRKVYYENGGACYLDFQSRSVLCRQFSSYYVSDDTKAWEPNITSSPWDYYSISLIASPAFHGNNLETTYCISN